MAINVPVTGAASEQAVAVALGHVIPPGTCWWCMELEGSEFCCNGDTLEARAAMAEMASSPVIFIDRRMSTSDGAR